MINVRISREKNPPLLSKRNSIVSSFTESQDRRWWTKRRLRERESDRCRHGEPLLTVLFLPCVIKICVDGCGASGRITDRRGRLFQFPTNHPCLQRFTCRRDTYYRKFERTCRDSKESVVRPCTSVCARENIARSRCILAWLMDIPIEKLKIRLEPDRNLPYGTRV